VEEHSGDPTEDEEEVPVKKVSLADALNCAETFLEFLEQESDSNFSDILTLRKLRTSTNLKRSMYGGINRSFSGRLRLSVIILLSGQLQPVISPDNRGSTVVHKSDTRWHEWILLACKEIRTCRKQRAASPSRSPCEQGPAC
jgi:hypothetical protein